MVCLVMKVPIGIALTKQAHRFVSRTATTLVFLSDACHLDESVDFEELLSSWDNEKFPGDESDNFMSSPDEIVYSHQSFDDMIHSETESKPSALCPQSVFPSFEDFSKACGISPSNLCVFKQPPVKSKRGRKPSRSKRIASTSMRSNEMAYVQSLQLQLKNLMALRTIVESGVNMFAPDPSAQQRQVQKSHVQMFLTYRSKGVTDKNCWRDIVDDGFVLLMPCTPFCQPNGQICGDKRAISGVDALITDTGALHQFVQSLTKKCQNLKPDACGEVQLVFLVEPGEILVLNNKAMCDWRLSTRGLVSFGFGSEVIVDALLSCNFCNSDKIKSMEIVFDVMSFTSQLVSFGLLEGIPNNTPVKRKKELMLPEMFCKMAPSITTFKPITPKLPHTPPSQSSPVSDEWTKLNKMASFVGPYGTHKPIAKKKVSKVVPKGFTMLPSLETTSQKNKTIRPVPDFQATFPMNAQVSPIIHAELYQQMVKTAALSAQKQVFLQSMINQNQNIYG